jgi:solute carrier family 35 (UDP-sugar transporter), member A1/2/3
VAELIKMVYSAWMISKELNGGGGGSGDPVQGIKVVKDRLFYLVETSRKMFVLALIYGAMNILSFVALRNISAGMFTIFAQCKILTTATFSTILLRRHYSWVQWRALASLMFGVILFSEPIWGDPNKHQSVEGGNAILGSVAVVTEVILSGFASIYFEKVIKTDPLQLSIWERNFQLAMGSVPVYFVFLCLNAGGEAGYMGGWSFLAVLLTALGAAGGLLVALSIKYGDSILKTLATTSAIVLSSVLDYMFLGGPLTPIMVIAGGQVIVAICDYTFDPTPPSSGVAPLAPSNKEGPASSSESKEATVKGMDDDEEEGTPLVGRGRSRNSDA